MRKGGKEEEEKGERKVESGLAQIKEEKEEGGNKGRRR